MMNIKNSFAVKTLSFVVVMTMCVSAFADVTEVPLNPMELEALASDEKAEDAEEAFEPMVLDVKEMKKDFFYGYTLEEIKIAALGAAAGILSWEIAQFVLKQAMKCLCRRGKAEVASTDASASPGRTVSARTPGRGRSKSRTHR